ncbi:hypothetical protein ACQY0O_000185 [Thecaphora frezii]
MSTSLSATTDQLALRRRYRNNLEGDRFPLGRKLGLHARVTRLNLCSYLLHCSCSVLFLVFLNALQPFWIQQLSAKPNADHAEPQDPRRTGALSGTLIFSDELLSTLLAPLFGAAADLYGFGSVVPVSYVFIALGLFAYTAPSRPWPGLLFARLIFAVGGSGATAMLSAILASFSDPEASARARGDPTEAVEGERSSEPPHQQNSDASSHATKGAASASSHRRDRPALEDVRIPEQDDSLESPEPLDKNPAQSDGGNRHGRFAAVAGVFTGFGALVAVFGLVRLPQALASYFDRRIDRPDDAPRSDLSIRRATTATFFIAAVLALLVAFVAALGLRSPAEKPVAHRACRQAPYRITDAGAGAYGTLQDSTITIQSDSREARRSRLRERLRGRERAGWGPTARRTLRDFVGKSIVGFRLAGSVPRAADRNLGDLAWELRMAYLGGALARACTIGTTAFLPLLVAQQYYASGICNRLPSPDPDAPLPPDAIKELCRQAFTATAILGGTAQLAALMLSPAVGLLCDRLTPSLMLALTSVVGAIGFSLLGLGTRGSAHDGETGGEIVSPLSMLSILAAVAVGFGQIGAIVASLAGCARARSRLVEVQRQRLASEDTVGRQPLPNLGGVSSEAEPLLIAPDAQASAGPGSIAGAYTCTGSISILVVSKLGGYLFDLFPPAPFLLIAGLSGLVAIAGFFTALVRLKGR